MLGLALDVSLRSVAAAAAVGLVLVGFRVRSGAVRHAAWSAVLVTMLMMPALVAVVPRVEVPVPSSVASGFETIAGEVSPYPRQEMPPTPESVGPSSSAVVPGPAVDARVTPARAVIDARTAMMALYGVGVLFFLADLQYAERRKAIEDRLRATGGAPTAFDDFSDTTTAAVSTLPIEDRLFFLPGASELAYMRAENVDYTARQKPAAEQARALERAAQGFAQARQYANDALALARTNEQVARDNDVVYRAETVLGVLALKDGDRTAAVEHMRTAGAAPMPDPPRYTSDFGMRSRLAEYLLRAGERVSVAEYLEKSAERRPIERDQLLLDAARVREGMMPVSYQYAEARR
jgi:hypothetical protein